MSAQKEKMDIAKEKQEDNKLFKCKKCSKSYKRKITVENHTKHGCKGDGIWADESEEQPRIPKASKTPKKKNAQKSKTNADKNNAEKEKIFTCKKCNKSYGNKITILRHRYRGCPKQWIWVGPSSPLWKARR